MSAKDNGAVPRLGYPFDKTGSKNANKPSIEEEFCPQDRISYDEALDILINGDCCFGVYDEKIKVWRTAIYVNKYDRTNRITVRFTKDDERSNSSLIVDKFRTLKEFPADYIMIDPDRFKTTERELRDMSNVPKEQIDLWKIRTKTPPPQPNQLLLFGYIRENSHKQIPSPIIELVFKWYYHNHKYGITYKQALDALQNKECCIGAYDFKLKRWRNAIYSNHCDESETIKVRFDGEIRAKIQFETIKNFPVRCVIIDVSKFKTNEKSLRNLSNVSSKKIDEWAKRQWTMKYSDQLEILSSMGFTDNKRMIKALKNSKGNVETAALSLSEL